MRKKTLILPIILVVCLMATACGTQSESKQEEKTAVVKMKYPVSVDDAKQKVAEKNEQVKVVAEKATVTPTVTPELTQEPTPEPTPEPVEEPMPNAEPVIEEPVLVEEPEEPVILESVETSEEPIGCSDFTEDVQYGTEREDCYDVPPQEEIYDSYAESEPVYESYDVGMQLLGTYYVVHYSAEACGNSIGAAGVEGGMVEGVSIAMPEYWMLGHWVYVECLGKQFRVDDISPDGVADIFHYYEKDAVGATYSNVYLVG